jgi:hypothetical protein
LAGDFNDGWLEILTMVGWRFQRWLAGDFKDGWLEILTMVGWRF